MLLLSYSVIGNWDTCDVWAIWFFYLVHGCMLSCFSHIQLFVTLWTVSCQAPLSVGFSRQEYWSGLISRGPSWLRDWTHVSYVSCIGKWVLYHQHPLGRSLGTEFLLDVAPWGSLLSVKCCWFSTWTRLSLIFISSVQSLSHTRLFATHGLRHASLPCLSPAPGACSNSCPSSQ